MHESANRPTPNYRNRRLTINTQPQYASEVLIANLNPEERTQALYFFFGWQGGTVHQLAAATGLTVSQILYEPLSLRGDLSSAFTGGWSSIRTCSRAWRRNTLTLAPQRLGDFEYWSGAISGYWATGPLPESRR